MQWYTFESRTEMAKAVEAAVTRSLIAGLVKNSRASWAVSGGSTPLPLFEAMSEASLDWAQVQVALVDERWVSPDHPRSNEASVKKMLAQNKAAKARYFGMKTPHDSPFDGADSVNERYSVLEQPFDSVLLGMGPDGHTASFFPGAKGLERALDPSCTEICVALEAIQSEVTGDEVLRMSLSASAIIASPHVVLMITGEDKRLVLEEALKDGSDLPVGRLARLKPFEIYWAP